MSVCHTIWKQYMISEKILVKEELNVDPEKALLVMEFLSTKTVMAPN